MKWKLWGFVLLHMGYNCNPFLYNFIDFKPVLNIKRGKISGTIQEICKLKRKAWNMWMNSSLLISIFGIQSCITVKHLATTYFIQLGHSEFNFISWGTLNIFLVIQKKLPFINQINNLQNFCIIWAFNPF